MGSDIQRHTALIQGLHTRLAQECPIVGVSIGGWEDKTTWRITYQPQATEVQRSAAQAVIDIFDPVSADIRSALTKALDVAIEAIPSIDPRVKAVFVEWRNQIL